jgi:hypothetical protein
LSGSPLTATDREVPGTVQKVGPEVSISRAVEGQHAEQRETRAAGVTHLYIPECAHRQQSRAVVAEGGAHYRRPELRLVPWR